ncbi:hypothetical protein GCM10022252_62180 [Streptosporangium oxazolinicum]|uniref:Uncharacterized protein n=1 Tax=Streptosporangium oxazolinicum TaxID=909287 RepID=A0ABP8BD72_9ACTN
MAHLDEDLTGAGFGVGGLTQTQPAGERGVDDESAHEGVLLTEKDSPRETPQTKPNGLMVRLGVG